MKARLLLQVLFFFLTLRGIAQVTEHTYRGLVVGEELNEALIGAQFIEPASQRIVAITDEEGGFNFNHASDSLILSHTGSVSMVVYPGESDQKIVMLVELDLLNTVVVSENRRETQIKNSTVSMEIIRPELISQTSPTNIEQSIGRLNGVQVVDNQPNIRSGSGWSYGVGSRVQVMVDDMPMLSGDAGQPLWNFIPTEGLEGIEVIKGASSVIYGSSALNGVINIKLRKPKEKPFTLATLSTGFYDLPTRESLRYRGDQRNTITNLTIYHAGNHKGIGVSAGLNGLNDQGYKMGDHDQRIRAHIDLRKTFSKKNMVIGLNTSVQRGRSGSFLLWESWEKGYTTLDSAITETDAIRFKVDPYVKWGNDQWRHTVNTRILHVNNRIDNGDTANDQSNRSSVAFAEYRTVYHHKKLDLHILGGLLGMHSVTRSPLFAGDHSTSNMATYAQIDKEWTRLSINLGARYEHYRLDERSECKPVVRTGLNYKVASHSFLRFSYGQGYRFPSVAESFVTTSVGPLSIYPNPNLRSETGTNLELGFRQGLKIGKMGLLVDAAIFQMEFANMMEFTFGQWGPFVDFDNTGAGFITLNTGDTRIRGLESTIGFEMKSKVVDIQGFIGYTGISSKALEPNRIIATDTQQTSLSYLNTSSDTTGYGLKYRPKHQANADVILDFGKFSLGMGMAWQSKVSNIDLAFISFPVDLFVPGIQKSLDMDQSAYLTFNLRLLYDINDHFRAQLIINNLNNREYVIRPGDIAAPRSVRLQLAYTI